MKNLKIGVVCLVLSVLATPSLFGQTFGEITGRVSDVSGAGIPRATVSLTSISTNAARTTTSSDSGDYTIPAVPPGMYNMKIEQPGFKASISNNVVGDMRRLGLLIAASDH